MSTASLAHDEQEPTPLHPDAPSECDHDWHTEDVSRDPAMRVVKAECAKCGAKKMLTMDDANEWRSVNLTPPEQALTEMLEKIWTIGAEPPGPQPLTATERSAFLGLQARQREYVHAINEEERAIVAEIEARLGLDAGAIGVSHTVNAQTWQVVAMPQQDGEEAAASPR